MQARNCSTGTIQGWEEFKEIQYQLTVIAIILGKQTSDHQSVCSGQTSTDSSSEHRSPNNIHTKSAEEPQHEVLQPFNKLLELLRSFNNCYTFNRCVYLLESGSCEISYLYCQLQCMLVGYLMWACMFMFPISLIILKGRILEARLAGQFMYHWHTLTVKPAVQEMHLEPRSNACKFYQLFCLIQVIFHFQDSKDQKIEYIFHFLLVQVS